MKELVCLKVLCGMAAECLRQAMVSHPVRIRLSAASAGAAASASSVGTNQDLGARRQLTQSRFNYITSHFHIIWI
jgi:hypothetical protein